MKNKLKKTIMEKTNWIEKIKEAVRIAMNKGVFLSGYEDKCEEVFQFYIGNSDDEEIVILCFNKAITISTKRGSIRIEVTLSDRDKLELQDLVLSIKEYKEDMAISEFNEFISSDKENKLKDINDLDNDEE